MESVADVIADLTFRGFCARMWDYPAIPGAIAIASGFTESVDGIQIYQNMVLVQTADSGWKVSCGVPSAYSEHKSLTEAVEVAAALVAELQAGGIPPAWLGRTRGCT